jgi:hypothetical protein
MVVRQTATTASGPLRTMSAHMNDLDTGSWENTGCGKASKSSLWMESLAIVWRLCSTVGESEDLPQCPRREVPQSDRQGAHGRHENWLEYTANTVHAKLRSPSLSLIPSRIVQGGNNRPASCSCVADRTGVRRCKDSLWRSGKNARRAGGCRIA